MNKKENRIKNYMENISAKGILINIMKYIVLLLGAAGAIVPALVVLIASLKTNEAFRNTSVLDLAVDTMTLKNYIIALIDGNMLRAFGNTIIILVVSLTIAIILGSMVAYVLSRFHFKGKKLIIILFLFATFIPGVTTQVATFRIIIGLGAFNTRWAAILLYMGTDIVSVYIFLQALKGVPISLDEAAIMEGATYFRIYRSIVLPMLRPAIATVIIIKGVAIYNDFYIPFLYMPKAELGVVSTVLYKFIGPYGGRWEVVCACVIITIIPTILVFLALQKQIYNGFASGAVKI